MLAVCLQANGDIRWPYPAEPWSANQKPLRLMRIVLQAQKLWERSRDTYNHNDHQLDDDLRAQIEVSRLGANPYAGYTDD